ncbi:hypothetical protein HXX76_014774 [Chlamydomonas incerta]|uniref:Acid phosphatase n=1 Tax=Chlamydomonas incerta TaxID=51695 RepID=A0A835SKP0_CHLIN|nr:hypothetical protein HXX76_014774 [Chlamydomonas incerta]|eukprot:KAG2424099.1 hypothetical protein HXX76_014774 [Chlamydomonas incerta]
MSRLPVPLPAVAAALGVAGALSGPRVSPSFGEEGPASCPRDAANCASSATTTTSGSSAGAPGPSSWLQGLLTSHRHGAAAGGDGSSPASTSGLGSLLPQRLQLPLALLTPVLADASGYDSSSPASSSSQAAAANAANAAAAPAAAAAAPAGGKRAGLVTLLPLGAGEGGPEGQPDTITGVFHRLDPSAAQLVLVQVVFRHGARTPLSDRAELWEGVAWDVCGEAYKAAGVRLFSTSGVENPVSRHDKRQRSVQFPGGCRKGELTRVGQAQARDLGAWLRQRYVLGGAGAGGEESGEELGGAGGGGARGQGFLPPQHQEGLVAARTTNISRTIATLRGVLTGLYPDLPTRPPQHDWVEQLQQQRQQQQAASSSSGSSGTAQQQQQQQQQQEHERLPYVTTSSDLDEILYADTRACPHLQSFRAVQREQGKAAVRADPDYAWARDTLLAVLPQLAAAGLDAAAFDSQPWIFTEVHDVLTSLAAHGKPLPLRLEALGPGGWEQLPRLLAAVDRLATLEFATEVAPSVRDRFGRAVMRLSMGRLLHTLVANMTAAAAAAGGGEKAAQAQGAVVAGSGAAAPRMYLYSGHDSTIMPLLSALGLDVSHWPPYLSNIVLELWQLPQPAPAPAAVPEAAAAAQDTEAAAAVAPTGSAAAAALPQRFVVRVLFNREELALPHCPQGYLPSLSTFSREVVGPFLLSAADQPAVCAVKMGHDTSLPQPKSKPAGGAAPAAVPTVAAAK